MIYANSDSCQQQLNGIEAIDYFMAQYLTEQLTMVQRQTEDVLLFHLLLALQWSLRQGHSCLPLNEITDKKTFWADPDNDLPGYVFPSLNQIKQCLGDYAVLPDDHAPVVLDKQALYLRRYWQFEVEIADALVERMELIPQNSQQLSNARSIFSQLFSIDDSCDEPDWQQVAVANAPGRRLSIISGGPGTGKTYTVTRLLATLQAIHHGRLNIQMAAPTGKAAQRLKESIVKARIELKNTHIDEGIIQSIPEEAVTLHRLLGIRPQRLELLYDEKNHLKCDVLLIDEVSMIDLPMMARVLRALADTSILILLGDADQLPAVETGNVLSDLTSHLHPGYTAEAVDQIQVISGQPVPENNASHYSHLTRLTQSHRYGGGEIANIVTDVINIRIQDSWKRLQSKEQKQIQFEFIEKGLFSYLPDTLFESWLIQACQYYFLKISTAESLKKSFSALSDFRILVASRVGERGVVQLNQSIEQYLSRNNKQIYPGKNYRGRPVMVLKNNYASGLFNGDVGIIWPDNKGKLAAWFETKADQYRSVSLSRLPAIETVYCMTIHKTQGSEFAHVAVVLPTHPSKILSPELLYTGLTRARDHLYIITSEAIWKTALRERTRRFSGLRSRLE